jgi:hypothetical protein
MPDTDKQYLKQPGSHDYLIPTLAHAAATATEKFPVFYAPDAGYLHYVGWTPAADITGANTDTTHMNLIDTDGDGNGTTEVAAKDWTAGVNAVNEDEIAIYNPAAASRRAMSAGDQLTLQFEKVGNGLAIPAGLLRIVYGGAIS